MKKVLLTIICCLVILPASAWQNKAMERCLSSWKGYSIYDVMSVWGAPTKQVETDEALLYYWEQSESYVYGKPYVAEDGISTCTRILGVDEDYKVISYKWEGKACPICYLTVKKWVNPKNNPWQIERDKRQQERMQNPYYQKMMKILKK